MCMSMCVINMCWIARIVNVAELTERIVILMTPEQVRAIDEYRREQSRLPSRADAIRELVQKALAEVDKKKASP